MSYKFVNNTQTKEQRRIKYLICRKLGFSRNESYKLRDYRISRLNRLFKIKFNWTLPKNVTSYLIGREDKYTERILRRQALEMAEGLTEAQSIINESKYSPEE